MTSVLEHTVRGSLGTVIDYPLPKEAADAVAPGLAFGYVVPTLLMMWPFENKDTWQKFVALWQPFPIHVGLLVASLSSVLHKRMNTAAVSNPKMRKDQASGRLRKQEKSTQSTLKLVYMGGAAATALVHLWAIWKISSDSDLSFSAVFGKLGFLLSGRHASTSEGDILTFFQRDMLLNAASVFAHNVFRICHLLSLGYITTNQALTVSLVTLAAQPIVGPAAVHIGFLGWRENVFVKVQHRISGHI